MKKEYTIVLADYLKIKPALLNEQEKYYDIPSYSFKDEEWIITEEYSDLVYVAKEFISDLIERNGYNALNWGKIGGIEKFLNSDYFEDSDLSEEDLSYIIRNDTGIIKGDYIDKEAAADAVINSEGIEHYLAYRDGEVVEHDFEGVIYYIFRAA